MIRKSISDVRNPALEDADWSPDYHRKSNLRFFSDAVARLRQQGALAGGVAIGLLGQRDLPGVALRRAQSILRWDLRPSLWSHAFLIVDLPTDAEQIRNATVREVTLHSRTGAFPEPNDNAVTTAPLRVYSDRRLDSNAAVLAVQMREDQAADVAARATTDLNLDRQRYDLWRTLGVWQTFMWSAGAAPNPLREGFPVFSSSFVEYCFEAIQLDLAPGASETNSAPEHLWNAAVWWHEEFNDLDHPITGYYVLRDPKCALLDPHELDKGQADA